MASVSPTRNEVLEELVKYTALSTDLADNEIIRGKQNAPVPNGSYCTITYLTYSSNGLAEMIINPISGNDAQVNEVTNLQRIYSYSIQFYRNDATAKASAFMLFYQTSAGKLFFETSFFTLKNISLITENASVISNNYQERAILTVDLYVRESIIQVVNKVNEIDINLKYNKLESNIKVIR